MESPAGGSSFRGFLFADLRGYTAYVERHGNTAAAELLARYRTLVRAEVANHRGAEIKTEGDSFYVAFPSARAAVECGLAIAAEAERATRNDPAHPIQVGIGVHAGETVETGEGYVGSVVNIAARVAAQARAGEVLVTATVRELVRGNLDATFEPRGRRRLKGVDGEVVLFVARMPATVGTRTRSAVPWPAVVATALAAAALVAVLAVFARAPGGGPPISPGADATQPIAASAAASSLEDIELGDELQPGTTYVLHFASIGGAAAFPTLSFTFTVPATGWDRVRAEGVLWRDEGMRIGFVVVDNVYVDPCDPDLGLRDPAVGPSVDDLARALIALPPWQVRDVDEGTYFGFSGSIIKVAAPAHTASCADGEPRLFHTLGNPGYVPALVPSELVDLWILNVQGTRVVIGAHWAPDAPAEEVEEMRAILDSIEIDP